MDCRQPGRAALLLLSGATIVGVAGSVAGRAYIVAVARRRVIADPGLIDSVTRSGGESGAIPGAVLGAGLRSDGRPTALLARRVEAGVLLYRMGKVSHLVMSGAETARGNQPRAMGDLAIELGVPSEHIELDLTGVDTAATCGWLKLHYRRQPVVLVTQSFHAHRTAYLANKAGLDAQVFATPDGDVRAKARRKAKVREVPASVKAIGLDRFR